ncbi:hypothetical protein D3C85_1230550 [compost metagenome]
MVFDNAVVHHRHLRAGKVRVGVFLARRPMGGPTGVGNTQLADDRFGCDSRFQFADLTDTTTTLQRSGLSDDGEPGAVVAAVFQALEAFD